MKTITLRRAMTIAVLLVLLPASRARAQQPAAERGDITVLPDPFLLGTGGGSYQEDAHGYVEYRISILNHSPTARHRVSLTIPKKTEVSTPSGHLLRALKATAEVAPASAGAVSLFQPNLPLNYSAHGLDVAVDGRPSAASGPLVLQHDRGDRQARRSQPRPAAFTRSILTTDLAGLLQPQVFQSAVGQPLPTEAHPSIGFISGTYQNQPYHYIPLDRFHDAAVPVHSWSTHWLGYSSHDGIVLRGADLQAAPAAVLAALRQYVECGGSLLVVGATPLPDGWNWARHDQHGLAAYYPGFGQCLVMPKTAIDQWKPREWRAIVAMWEQSVRPWTAVQTPDAANQRFPVVDSVNMPIRDLFSVMLVFAILIGPVNILVLSWARRRIWLLWTVPTFSLLTCAAVVAYMSLTEDWQGRKARLKGLTILDERAGRATSIGWLGLYTPYTPGDGLHFSKDTELSPHLLMKTYDFFPPRTMDWSTDQHLTSNWLIARIPAHFLVRTTAECSQRLVVDRHADGSRSCVNGLNATIATVWVADADGQIYTATDVPPDGKAALARTTRKAAGTGAHLRQAFAADWLEVVDAMAAEPQAYLQPRCYLAVLDAAPFIPLGLDSPTSERSRSVVFGIMPAR